MISRTNSLSDMHNHVRSAHQVGFLVLRQARLDLGGQLPEVRRAGSGKVEVVIGYHAASCFAGSACFALRNRSASATMACPRSQNVVLWVPLRRRVTID